MRKKSRRFIVVEKIMITEEAPPDLSTREEGEFGKKEEIYMDESGTFSPLEMIVEEKLNEK